VKNMKRGSVIVDISIDQGGFAETSRPTTHAHPSYVAHGVVHYCVTNMRGAVAHTSTFALNNATLPFVLALADKGIAAALRSNPHLLAGLIVHAGSRVTGREMPIRGPSKKVNAGRKARPGGERSL
jgi:alanine dehydrogenase